jgi:hypothetical protein
MSQQTWPSFCIPLATLFFIGRRGHLQQPTFGSMLIPLKNKILNSLTMSTPMLEVQIYSSLLVLLPMFYIPPFGQVFLVEDRRYEQYP